MRQSEYPDYWNSRQQGHNVYMGRSNVTNDYQSTNHNHKFRASYDHTRGHDNINYNNLQPKVTTYSLPPENQSLRQQTFYPNYNVEKQITSSSSSKWPNTAVRHISAKNFDFSSTYEDTEDKQLLIKYGITLYESDVKTLDGWLSDTIVNFAVLHLYHSLPHHVKTNINVVQSTSCDVIKYDSSNAAKEIFANLGIAALNKYQFFLFNNNSNFGYGKGTHWSLLLFVPYKQQLYYFDSITASVPVQVQQFASKIIDVLCIRKYPVASIQCPRMKSGGDCGIFLIEHVRCLFNNIYHKQSFDNFDQMERKNYMANRRQHWKNLINDLIYPRKNAVSNYRVSTQSKKADVYHESKKSERKIQAPSHTYQVSLPRSSVFSCFAQTRRTNKPTKMFHP